MMLHAIKNFRIYSFPQCLSSNLGGVSTSALRFCTRPDSSLDMTQNPSEKAAEDVMSNSFTEGYATRSDEKGFEGANGGNNQSTSKLEMDKFIHEDHPAYDKTQRKRSEVKEK